MKYALFILTLCFFTSCERESNQTVYEGVWKVENINGSIAGNDQEVNWEYMKVEDDIITLHDSNDEKLYEAKIEIVATQSFGSDRVTFDVEFNDSDESKLFHYSDVKYFFLDGDKLTVNDECCDLFNYTFVKK